MNPRVLRRRVFLTAGAGLALAPVLPLRAAPRAVTVLTSYPDEVVSRFETAFERAYPAYRLKVIWRMPHEAAPYLRQPQASGVDVYWAASPRVFSALAREGVWQKLGLSREGLPALVGRTPLVGPDDLYAATELAGFGFAINPAVLARQQLPVPRDWPDLAQPAYAGQIALPVPARVGYAPPIVETVLQAFGWEQGWALWSQIVANAVLVDRGATLVQEEVAAGRCAVGVSIDFFVNSAVANGARIDLVYPTHTGLNPAHVAITQASSNPEGARAWVGFVLSAQGQALLAHPDIRRLPVRPAAYGRATVAAYNPFAAAQAGQQNFDAEAARPRLALSSAVFQQMLVEPQAELRPLWQRVRAGEAAGRSVAQARRCLEAAPLTEAEAADPALRRLFASRLEGAAPAELSGIEAGWAANARQQRAEAARWLEQAGA